MPRKRYLVLCPHPDDGPLSLGGAIQFAPRRTTLLTVFSRSGWTAAGVDEDVGKIARLREKEDRLAARRLGSAVVRYAGLPSASLRYGVRNIFNRVDVTKDPCYPRVLRHLKARIKELEPELVFAPLGLGLHIDHRLLAQAALAIAARGGRRFAFYEDVPYAAALDDAQIEEHAAGLARQAGLTPTQHRIPLTLEQVRRKLWALGAYASQGLSLDAIRRYTRRRGRWEERVYLLAPAGGER